MRNIFSMVFFRKSKRDKHGFKLVDYKRDITIKTEQMPGITGDFYNQVIYAAVYAIEHFIAELIEAKQLPLKYTKVKRIFQFKRDNKVIVEHKKTNINIFEQLEPSEDLYLGKKLLKNSINLNIISVWVHCAQDETKTKDIKIPNILKLSDIKTLIVSNSKTFDCLNFIKDSTKIRQITLHNSNFKHLKNLPRFYKQSRLAVLRIYNNLFETIYVERSFYKACQYLESLRSFYTNDKVFGDNVVNDQPSRFDGYCMPQSQGAVNTESLRCKCRLFDVFQTKNSFKIEYSSRKLESRSSSIFFYQLLKKVNINLTFIELPHLETPWISKVWSQYFNFSTRDVVYQISNIGNADF